MYKELKESIEKLRNNRLSNFESNWLLDFAEKYNVYFRDNGSYSFETEKFGIIDYYPKANKILIRKGNKWIKPGLKWLIKNIL